jgi:ATP-binding cassette subfamily B protein
MKSNPPKVESRTRRVLRNLRQSLELAWSASPKSLIRYLFLGILNAAMPATLVYLGAMLISQIADARFHALKLDSLLYILLPIWMVSTLQRGLSSYLGFGRNVFVRCVELEAERKLLAKASEVDIGNFDNSNWHDRLMRSKRDASWRFGDLTWSILGIFGDIVTLVLMSSLLANLHYVLFFLAAIAAFLSLAIESRLNARLYAFNFRETEEDRERAYLGDIMTQPRNSKEIRAYVLRDYLLERHSKLSNSLIKKRIEIYRPGIKISLITGFVTGTTLALAYLFVSVKGIQGEINAGGVVLVIGAFTTVSATLRQISSTFLAVDQHTTFLNDYFSFLAIKPLLKVTPYPSTMSDNLSEGIEFDNVSFKYPGGHEQAIDGFNLCVRKGELIAIVGENGVGKSSIVKLLLRFYDADKGSVKVGGVDVKNLEPDMLRKRIGVLFQDYATYELTVKENVVMGRPDIPIDEERVIQALRNSHCEWLVNKMPKGIDSKLGHLFEGGHDLSGGEWQRLALARLMYRNADIWILDEPTSSLDPEAEAAIFTELKENLKGRIGIVISHRFSTVRMADRIAFISDGKVVEIGSHEDLLLANGRYAKLFKLQASGYS